MDTIKHFKKCNIMGEGEIASLKDGKDNRFSVLDMSASKVTIITSRDLKDIENVKLSIRLGGHVTEVVVKTEAKVESKAFEGSNFIYEMKFIDLPLKTRVEIDEFIRHSCKFDHTMAGIDSFEYGGYNTL